MPVEMTHYDYQTVADGVVAAIATAGGGGRGNSALVRAGDGVLVFDTGMTPQAGAELREAAEQLGPVRWVVNSHWHGDHVRGNQAFADVEIVATARTRELIETRAAEQVAAQQALDWDAALAEVAGETPSATDRSFASRAASMREVAATIADVELRPPTRVFDDRLELAPGCEIVCLGGGHTESDAFLVLADRRVAVVADLLTVEMHPWLGAGSPERWLEILLEIEALDVDVLIPGHGRVATAHDVRVFREHLRSFVADPEGIEARYPDWDFWGDTADGNRSFLGDRTGPSGDLEPRTWGLGSSGTGADALSLREITDENRDAVVALRLGAGQHRFVSTVAESLREADETPAGKPWYRAVYAGERPVGFVMLSWNVTPDPPEIIGPWFLWKLLVDEAHQHRGYGRETVRLVTDIVRANGATTLHVSYAPGDGGPEPFYRGLGFLPTGELDPHGEVVLALDLGR